jgi:hypothetical protein
VRQWFFGGRGGRRALTRIVRGRTERGGRQCGVAAFVRTRCWRGTTRHARRFGRGARATARRGRGGRRARGGNWRSLASKMSARSWRFVSGVGALLHDGAVGDELVVVTRAGLADAVFVRGRWPAPRRRVSTRVEVTTVSAPVRLDGAAGFREIRKTGTVASVWKRFDLGWRAGAHGAVEVAEGIPGRRAPRARGEQACEWEKDGRRWPSSSASERSCGRRRWRNRRRRR